MLHASMIYEAGRVMLRWQRQLVVFWTGGSLPDSPGSACEAEQLPKAEKAGVKVASFIDSLHAAESCYKAV